MHSKLRKFHIIAFETHIKRKLPFSHVKRIGNFMVFGNLKEIILLGIKTKLGGENKKMQKIFVRNI